MAKHKGGGHKAGGKPGGKPGAAGAKVISKVLSETRTFHSRSGKTREYELIHPNKSREGELYE